MKNGQKTYGYADPEMAEEERRMIRNITRTKKYTEKGTYPDGTPYYIWKLDGQDPYAAHGNHSIISADSLGRRDTRSYDKWDFGGDNVGTNDIPGMVEVRVGHRAN